MFRLIWFALILACAGSVRAATVAIVLSERTQSYMEAAEAVKESLRRVSTLQIDVVQLGGSAVIDDLTRSPPKLFIALGAAAFAGVLAKEVRVPVIAALIPKLSFERLLRDRGKSGSAPVSSVYLDQPVGRQLDLLRLALPEARRVGVLFGRESVLQKAAWLAQVQSRNLQLESDLLVGGESQFAGLKDLLSQVDVLLALADPQIFNSASVPHILLATYRARVPVLAFSQAYVKAGALLALYSTPAQAGTQAGAMARGFLAGDALPEPQDPIDFQVSVNTYVARSLGLDLDEAALKVRLRNMERRP
ncbi:MAG: hypothetical protein K9K38_03445 [Rhodoferax sp.]|nr:hypothetical protein [Rhodoferax sp.]